MAKYMLNIPPHSDRKIYEAFSRIVNRWPGRVTFEHMRVAGNLELTPGFMAPEASRAVLRLIDAEARAVDELTIVVDGLNIEYLRADETSGSLYDKLYLSIPGSTGIPVDEMMQMVVALADELGTVEMRRLRGPLANESDTEHEMRFDAVSGHSFDRSH